MTSLTNDPFFGLLEASEAHLKISSATVVVGVQVDLSASGIALLLEGVSKMEGRIAKIDQRVMNNSACYLLS